jgi:hypothetical protein
MDAVYKSSRDKRKGGVVVYKSPPEYEGLGFLLFTNLLRYMREYGVLFTNRHESEIENGALF